MGMLDNPNDPNAAFNNSTNYFNSTSNPSQVSGIGDPFQDAGLVYGGTPMSQVSNATPYSAPPAAGQLSQPGYQPNPQGGGAASGFTPSNSGGGGGGQMAAPIHHTFQEYLNNGQAVGDQTYVNQKAALLQKLSDYQRNVATQVGGGNLSQTNSADPKDLLGFSWGGKSLDPKGIYNNDVDANGDNHFSAKTDAQGGLGGTLGKDYATGIANFQNQQANGLRNTAEDFASRGMLGSGSGVWQTARNNLQDQYGQQLTDMTDGAVGQYNNLISGLADQYSQARPTLTGYAGDAANRIATGMNAGLPTSV